MRVTSLMLASLPRGNRLVLTSGQSEQGGHRVVSLASQAGTGVGNLRALYLGCLRSQQGYNRYRLFRNGDAPLHASVFSTEVTEIKSANCCGPKHRVGF